MATSEDVARLAGVSRATVSRTLNGSTRVDAKTRQRVHAAIASLGYEPDVAARNLVGQRARVIALTFFANESWALSQFGLAPYHFYVNVLREIEHESAAAGYDLVLPARPYGKGSHSYVRSLQARRVAGVIMLACQQGDPRIPALIEADVPTVFIDAVGRGPHATYVESDNVGGARLLTEHLLQLGHRRIAVVAGSGKDASGNDRLAGTRSALGRAGVPQDPALVREADWTTEGAYRATVELLREDAGCTAIMAHSDMMAIGVLRALHEAGLRIPEDVSVAGFDDIDLSKYAHPPLTTVRQDQVAIGGRAVAVLRRMIEEGAADPEPVVVPTQLVVRQSTGPAAQHR